MQNNRCYLCPFEQHPGLKNKRIPLHSKGISESVWQGIKEYKPYADYDLPLLYFGDFHSARKEEQNKFLLDVNQSLKFFLHDYIFFVFFLRFVKG